MRRGARGNWVRGGTPALLVGLLILAGLGPPGTAAESRERLMIGDMSLSRCAVLEGVRFQSWCGTLIRSLGDSSTIPIRFSLTLPRNATTGSVLLSEVLQRPLIAAFEGGPGYGGIDSGYEYVEMLGSLMLERAFLVMDARGTGRSSAINCPAVQRGTMAYPKAVRACAQRLGPRVDDYGTAQASDDAAAIIESLGFRQVDVYGDSYGTFMAQVFAGRHPTLIRSLVLDGAYPVVGEDAWYPTQGPTLVASLRQVCEADPSCRTHRWDTVQRMGTLIERLRTDPIVVVAPGGDSQRHRIRIEPSDLLDVAFHGTYTDVTYQEFDPAIRAALTGDPLPLGRLVAEFQFPGGPPESPSENSAGQFLAVTCQDYPQLYDMTQPPPVRQAQLLTAIETARSTTPDLFAPFTIDDYLASSWETIHDCVTWAQLPPEKSGPPAPPTGTYPDVPVLVLSGTLDTITTADEGRMVTRQFPRSRAVDIPFGLHVQAMGNTVPCAAAMTRAFFQDPEGFLALDNNPCSAPRPRIVPRFTRKSDASDPARAVVLTVADALSRVQVSGGDLGNGLRGGSWEVVDVGADEVTVHLHSYRLFADLPVTGKATWKFGGGGVATVVRFPGGRLKARWSDASPTADVRGTLAGSRLPVRVLAP